ncbi:MULTISPECIES: type II toxin-antitoxin system VapC family toxin [unclassified Archaeoglobus]|jgi:predicted nucleic acid-binding protein|uniref:type II toxin-antitoxin system VapC family toxin n=1 Tax=unclassified Archaeoglobus TaxID=2643606 RepID=UPI0025BA594B|nr:MULTISPECIES: type II toxin-antitoxin system VapC family toxin [unclassified Archaeoglobus]
MYLVDTDIIIDVLRGFEGSKEFLLKIAQEGIAISTITVAEIISGKESRDAVTREKILRFLRNFEIVPLTMEISVVAGEIRRDYRIGIADAVIAATALNYGMTVVTGNVKHFERVKGLKLLKPDYR